MRIKLVLSTFTILFLVCFSAFGQKQMVRMVYFYAKDKEFNMAETQIRMENLAKTLTSFYKGLNIEKDNDNFKVHYIETDHNASEYINILNKAVKITNEIRKKTDFGNSKHLYLIATNVDNPSTLCGVGDITLNPTFWQSFFGKTSVDVSWAVFYENTMCDSELIYFNAAHELGHAFGLLHDFRNRTYIMSYGTVEIQGPRGKTLYHTPYELSKCTKSWLRASRFFEDDPSLSKTSPAGDVKVSKETYYDPDTQKFHLFLTGPGVPALHQVNLYLIPTSVPDGFLPGYSKDIRQRKWDNTSEINKYSLHNCCIFDDTQTNKNKIVFDKISMDDIHPDRIRVNWIDVHGNVSETVPDYNIPSVENIPIDSNTISSEPLTNVSTQGARLRYRREGHTDSVSSLTFSPNGRTLVSGSMDNTIRLWNPDTGAHTNTLIEHTEGVTSVAYSVNGNVLASVGWDHTIRYWNPHTGHLITSNNRHENALIDVALTSVVAVDPNGESYWFATGGLDNDVWLWHGSGIIPDLTKHALPGHTNDVSSVDFSAGEAILASGSYDNTVRLWNANEQKHISTLIGHTDFVTSVAFSPDGQILASGSRDNTVRLWDIENYVTIAILDGHSDWVLAVAFSPDGQTLASGGNDRTIRLWDVATHKTTDTLRGHTDGITTVAFSPDRKTLASAGGRDNSVYVWDLSPTPITAPTVRITPSPVISPTVGDNLVIDIDISGVENVAGYQVTVQFDPIALKYVDSEKGQFLPTDSYFALPVVNPNQVTIAATSLAGESVGNGTLATLTFEVMEVIPSDIIIYEAIILRQDLTTIPLILRNGNVVLFSAEALDVNGDGVVNISDLKIVAEHIGKTGLNKADVNNDGVVDIRDLLLVANIISDEAAAPSVSQLVNTNLNVQDIQTWLSQAEQLDLNDVRYQKGIALLQQLLSVLTPKQTALLPNYPNPFNPETWIPYHLATPSDVNISIYTSDGKLVRVLKLGHQTVGIHQEHWDGKNAYGERVASGIYFYTLRAGNYTATRKMSIAK